MIGHIYETCKDQHGCRFLQRKLEDSPEGSYLVHIIYDEVYQHIVELMTGELPEQLIAHC